LGFDISLDFGHVLNYVLDVVGQGLIYTLDSLAYLPDVLILTLEHVNHHQKGKTNNGLNDKFSGQKAKPTTD
jgi:hypothetical protein